MVVASLELGLSSSFGEFSGLSSFTGDGSLSAGLSVPSGFSVLSNGFSVVLCLDGFSVETGLSLLIKGLSVDPTGFSVEPTGFSVDPAGLSAAGLSSNGFSVDPGLSVTAGLRVDLGGVTVDFSIGFEASLAGFPPAALPGFSVDPLCLSSGLNVDGA